MGSLSFEECTNVLKKIRSKYDILVSEYKKSPLLKENFEERYRAILKSRNNLEPFFIGEIQAVQELLEREEAKAKENSQKTQFSKDQKEKSEAETKSYADVLMAENLNRIRKYPNFDLGDVDAIEDVTRLLGAMRVFINDYYPALLAIFKNYRHLLASEKISTYYDSLMEMIDYKGEVPIARRYKDLLVSRMAPKVIEYEYRHIIQEVSFLLNDIYDCLLQISRNNEIPSGQANKIVIGDSKMTIASAQYRQRFNGRTFSEAFQMVSDYAGEIINDFRIRGIRRRVK